MKWIYDSSLITRQVIAWAFLLGIWGVLMDFFELKEIENGTNSE